MNNKELEIEYNEFMEALKNVRNDLNALEKELKKIESCDMKRVIELTNEYSKYREFRKFFTSLNRRGMNLRESLKEFKTKII